ncbi:MAG: carboxypeptidase-like regulatory domain-containing protein [Salinivirgaceae bacterium]|nr:carboxypeptidase-like regulatory domain-containing protein [Salinivirgaceae bacterium]
MQKFWIFLIFIFILKANFAQLINPDTITISGVVLDADSLNPMSNVHIRSQKNRGAITDNLGQFTVKINKNDTLTFTYVGFKPYVYVIPDTLKVNNYIAGVILNKDIISLSEVLILPWMNKQQFKKSFIQNSPDQNTINAQQNLTMAGYTARASAPKWTTDAMIDWQLKQYTMNIEYRGMISPNQQVNLMGLAQFLIFYTHQQLTKEEKARKLKEELRQYIQEQQIKD